MVSELFRSSCLDKKEKRRATSTGTKEGRNRRETSTGTQPEAGGTSKSMKEENPCPGEERKRETSIGAPPGPGPPARTKSNHQNMLQKNRFLRKEKRERKKKREMPRIRRRNQQKSTNYNTDPLS
jgi:hypothetical protein